jgi:hypothetical protein
MMDSLEREVALQKMRLAIRNFYQAAVDIGVHPFIEFAGVMTAYEKTCTRAHADGIDFTDCNRHTGQALPMAGFEVKYLAEKLDCIFDGRIVAVAEETVKTPT